MVVVLPSRFLAGFAAVLAAAACPRALPAAEDDADRALIGQYCLACHNDDLRTAGVSLQGADPADVTQRPALWEKALRKVTSGEMPPAGMPAPDAASAAGFAARLEKALDAAAAAAPNPGRVPAHRLNRAEYSNAVRDLLALDLDAGDMLPADDSGYGFDNIADVLSLSPALLDRYMFAARRISRMAVGSGPEKAQKDIFVRNRETGFLHAGHGSASRQDLPIGADRGAALRYYFPLDGEYVISTALDQGDSRTAYESHELRLRVKAGMRVLALTFPANPRVPSARGRPAPAGPSRLIRRSTCGWTASACGSSSCPMRKSGSISAGSRSTDRITQRGRGILRAAGKFSPAARRTPRRKRLAPSGFSPLWPGRLTAAPSITRT